MQIGTGAAESQEAAGGAEQAQSETSGRCVGSELSMLSVLTSVECVDGMELSMLSLRLGEDVLPVHYERN